MFWKQNFCRELFGDGLNWGGCLLISLLYQQRRFKAYDFSSRLFQANQMDKKDSNIRGIVSSYSVELPKYE